MKTSYEVVNGNILRQKIDLKNAVFPVMADPIWCGNQIYNTSWVKNGEGWTLRTIPTYCGRFLSSNNWDAWTEVLNRTSNYGYQGYNVYYVWNKQYGTSTYWSMYDQFVCHYNNPAAQIIEGEWNLEPSRPNVGLSATYANFCNPN